MNAQQYRRWTAPLRARPKLVRALTAGNKALTYVGYAAYPLLVALVALSGEWTLLARVILGPGLGFVLLTQVRKAVNKPDPTKRWTLSP